MHHCIDHERKSGEQKRSEFSLIAGNHRKPAAGLDDDRQNQKDPLPNPAYLHVPGLHAAGLLLIIRFGIA